MRKQRLLAIVLCMILAFGLVACGDEKPAEQTGGSTPATTSTPATASTPGSASTPAEPAVEEEPFVEEEPAKNELDPSNVIPGVNKEYTLTEQVFEEENLILRLPEGVTAVNEGRGENTGHITVTDAENGWKLMFRPNNFGINNTINNVSSSVNYNGNWIKTDWSQDVATTVAGFPARVWANNIRKGWLHPANESDAPGVDIVMDYGETLVGEWLGMHVRLEALDPQDDTNIYHYLYNSKLRAVLNNFSCIETPGGVEATANGIAVTLPARWPVKAGDNSIVAHMQSSNFNGGFTFNLQYNTDIQHHVDSYEGEQFTRTYGDNEWTGVIAEHVFEKEDEDPTILHSMYLFAPYNEKMVADVHITCNSWDVDDFKAFLDDEKFVDAMTSIKLDPASWHQPGTAEVNGLLSSRGRIMSYSGTDEEVEIPAMIGEYNTVYIGPSAFENNTAVRKVIIPEGVTEIQPNAFAGCTNLEEVVLPDSLNFIYLNAFRDCPNLTDVVLPRSVNYVGFAAYKGSGKGTFTGSVAVYDAQAFSETTFDTISLPVGSDISADNMFSATKASEIILPEDLEVVGKGAFSNTENLHEINLPETVRVIGEYAFTNMRGLMSLNLPEGIEELPDYMTSSTTTDVIIVPASVKKIGRGAIYDASICVIQNPYVDIATSGVDADYIYLRDAKNYVFPSDRDVVMHGQILYLDGVYDAEADIQGDLYTATSIGSQFFLPMDATEAEAGALDAYLISIGYSDLAWISGTDMDLLPDSTYDYDYANYLITGYHGTGTRISPPRYVMQTDGTFWYTSDAYGIADEAFRGIGATEFMYRGNFGEHVGSNILADNPDLSDIWFNAQILFEGDYLSADSFAGIPETVTCHLPASFTDEQRTQIEAYLHSKGVPAGATFDYYSLREKAGVEAPAQEKPAAAAQAGSADTSSIAGSWHIAELEGSSRQEWLDEYGIDLDEIMYFEINADGTGTFYSDGEPLSISVEFDGSALKLIADGEELPGTFADGFITISFEDGDTRFELVEE